MSKVFQTAKGLIALAAICGTTAVFAINAERAGQGKASIAQQDGSEIDIARLQEFFGRTQAYTANFVQSSWDSNGIPMESSSGTLEIQRPNRFIWKYAEPYEQAIVSDGLNIWMHDVDLEQVTVRPLNESVSGSPAALISGLDLESAYDLVNEGMLDSGWVTLKPKQLDSDFQKIRLQLSDTSLETMELYDQFDQRTVVTFNDTVPNPDFGKKHFRFIPPEGTEIVGKPILFE
ncbi:MAG: outer membrane lipoprotein carrier protein [Gammaproteobacteria bacterium]|jgi:outer membrane lipoprotein carrier protein